MAEMPDVAEIRAALECLPARCRYHGDATEPPGGHYPRKACCDAGEPAHRRKLALPALERLRQQAAAERDRTGTPILICSSCGTQACAEGVLLCDEAKTASFLYRREAPGA